MSDPIVNTKLDAIREDLKDVKKLAQETNGRVRGIELWKAKVEGSVGVGAKFLWPAISTVVTGVLLFALVYAFGPSVTVKEVQQQPEQQQPQIGTVHPAHPLHHAPGHPVVRIVPHPTVRNGSTPSAPVSQPVGHQPSHHQASPAPEQPTPHHQSPPSTPPTGHNEPAPTASPTPTAPLTHPEHPLHPLTPAVNGVEETVESVTKTAQEHVPSGVLPVG